MQILSEIKLQMQFYSFEHFIGRYPLMLSILDPKTLNYLKKY